ncbi:MAG TPA: DUF3795 domain-containing protein [Anaerolineaceae bacterium]|nr:DUF3795 domain-containing protein [Anaerolineaceae bacterium]
MEVISRCGFRCDLCLAYAPNIIAHPENRRVLSDGWFKYFGFRIEPENIYCEGCLSKGATLDNACPVRPCVVERELENCAICDQYACEKLAERLVTYKELAQKVQGNVPEEDYLLFIKPYENRMRLEACAPGDQKNLP